MATEPLRWTSVIRLAIVAEGETEEEFIKAVLANHLRSYDVISQPILPRARAGPSGGTISVDRLADQMARLQWNFDVVTSLVDLYGFRGRQEHEAIEELEQRIDAAVDERIGRDSDRSRVFSYVQKHEFEGLLFSEVSAFASVLEIPRRSMRTLQAVRAEFTTPEDIDDGPTTAPSKRITHSVPGYRKRRDGPLIAERAGLITIRAECPRFDSWISRLELLAS